MTVLKSLLWLQLEDVLYLLGPHDDTAFEHVSLVLLRDVIARGQLMRGCRELGLALDLSQCHVCLSEVIIEFLNQVLGDKFCPTR